METLLIEADRAVLPGGVLEQGPVYVTVEGARISGVFVGRSSTPVTDLPRRIHTNLLCPGFVDIHTHGLGEGPAAFTAGPQRCRHPFKHRRSV